MGSVSASVDDSEASAEETTEEITVLMDSADVDLVGKMSEKLQIWVRVTYSSMSSAVAVSFLAFFD